jgi:hypothetical protein
MKALARENIELNNALKTLSNALNHFVDKAKVSQGLHQTNRSEVNKKHNMNIRRETSSSKGQLDQ